MNRLKIILSATTKNPFNRHINGYDDIEFAHFALNVDNFISAEKIMTQPVLIQNLKKFCKENHVEENDIKSAVKLETQLNSLGEFCISLNTDWFKQYFIVRIVH